MSDLYTKEQIERALKHTLGWHEYDDAVYTDSIAEDFWNELNRRDLSKYELLKQELHGLPVVWLSHSYNDTIDMARVNGHSIVWHKYAYTEPDEMTVEVYFRDADDVEAHVPIKGLRKRVSR